MSNMPRKEKADKNKYAGKAYLDYEEAADYLGIKRATLYNYITALKIQTHKFRLDRKRYLAIADVQRIDEIMDSPWLAGPDEEASQRAEEGPEAA